MVELTITILKNLATSKFGGFILPSSSKVGWSQHRFRTLALPPPLRQWVSERTDKMVENLLYIGDQGLRGCAKTFKTSESLIV
jgi:hypothetical protein